MENKDLLLSLLNLAEALKQKNKEGIDNAIAILNKQNDTDENINFIKDFLKNTLESKDTYIYIVDNLSLIKNKAFYKIYIELRTILKPTRETLIEYINTDMVFDDDYDKYLYFSNVTKKIIDFGDSELIKLAIDKIQSI